MSAIDQAFIRAYGPEGSPPTRPSPPPRSTAPPAACGLAPTAARRPLSTFTPPGPPAETGFKPALEVERFNWSTVCDALLHRCRGAFDAAVETLLVADDQGRSLIGLAGHSPGVGCTTIVLCLGRLLVDAGKTVAIVDGHFAAPGLARQLGLAAEVGWENVLAGDVPLAEAVINSLADGLAVVPLVRGGAGSAAKLETIHASVTAGVLRYHYDLVLFDLGALADPVQRPIAQRLARNCRLDGLLLAAPTGLLRAAGPDLLLQDLPELAGVGLGVIENDLLAA